MDKAQGIGQGNIYVQYFYISILSTCIDKTVLLVLCLWFPAPVGSLVFPTLLFLIALFFGFVHGLGVVLRGGIDCVEDLVVMLSVYVLFPCPGCKVHSEKE